MRKKDRQKFIDHMEDFGDTWTDEEVESVYGKKTLHEAIDDRMSLLGQFSNNIGKILNRKK